MKSTLKLLLFALIFSGPLFAEEAAKTVDPFEEGMRQAFTAYKKGDNEAVASKLRELLKIMDEKGAAKLGIAAGHGRGLERGDGAGG